LLWAAPWRVLAPAALHLGPAPAPPIASVAGSSWMSAQLLLLVNPNVICIWVPNAVILVRCTLQQHLLTGADVSKQNQGGTKDCPTAGGNHCMAVQQPAECAEIWDIGVHLGGTQHGAEGVRHVQQASALAEVVQQVPPWRRALQEQQRQDCGVNDGTSKSLSRYRAFTG
jgi:hypothetical protein